MSLLFLFKINPPVRCVYVAWPFLQPWLFLPSLLHCTPGTGASFLSLKHAEHTSTPGSWYSPFPILLPMTGIPIHLRPGPNVTSQSYCLWPLWSKIVNPSPPSPHSALLFPLVLVTGWHYIVMHLVIWLSIWLLSHYNINFRKQGFFFFFCFVHFCCPSAGHIVGAQ